MKLINKDYIVEELEKRKNAALMRQQNLEAIGQETVLNEMIAFELDRIISFINTLEVKKVDLEEEIEKCLKQHNMLAVGKKDFTDIAKHFFELGLKVPKGEQLMNLIAKDTLISEIEKLQLCTMDEHMNYYSTEAQGEYNALSKLKSFINTLEPQ